MTTPGMNLSHPDSPDVIQALETRCVICNEPPHRFCHNTIDLGRPLPMNRLVHIGRATKDKT